MADNNEKPIIHTEMAALGDDGTYIEYGHAHGGEGMSDAEKVMEIAEQRGVYPESVQLLDGGEEGRARRRASVAFSGSRWKSPWNPHAEKEKKGDKSTYL
jgi:hypothetical protein